MTNDSSLPYEIAAHFRSLAEWRDWANEHPYIFSADHARPILEHIQTTGIIDPLTNKFAPPQQIVIAHDNYRETIQADKLISRHRALLLEIKRIAEQGRHHLLTRKARIYAPEALTDFALYLSGMYPRFLGSEYAETEADKKAVYPIRTEDLTALSLESGEFDLVVSNEVFEHVPCLDQCLREIHRILNTSGVLVSTFPFAFNREKGVVKARVKGDQIEHLTEPEFHGNPMRPSEGSLVFELPAWDLVERAHAAGFDDAYFSFICSRRFGVLGKDLNGVFVFVATKQPLAAAEHIGPAPPAEAPAPHAARRETVAALIGLPRSGTTVLAAAVGAHPEVKAVFEPWNSEKKSKPSTHLGYEQFVERFNVRVSDNQHVLFVKETAVDLLYVHAIDCLLSDASVHHDVKLIWLWRDPVHTFLSEVQARKQWWGSPDLEVNEETFTLWAVRSLRAYRRLITLAVRHPTLSVHYGTFVEKPGETLKVIMNFLGLEFIPAQLEYFKHSGNQPIRGDLNVANNPQLISSRSSELRAAEAERIIGIISPAKYYEKVEAANAAAKKYLAGHAPNEELTRLFLNELRSICDGRGMPP